MPKRFLSAGVFSGHLPVLALLLFLLFSQAAFALEVISGDTVYVSEPIQDDIFVTAGTIYVDAPVSGAILGGGKVVLNEPVQGDVLAIGGDIDVNSEVYGRLVAIGGTVNVKGNVSTNLLFAGGSAKILPGAVIGRDAVFYAGMVSNEGEVGGNLRVEGGNLENNGSAGEVIVKKSNGTSDLELLAQALNILLLVSIFVTGLIVLAVFPSLFTSTEETVRESPVRSFLMGFVLAFVSPLLVILFLLSIVGIPVAFFLALAFVFSLMVSVLVISYAVGGYIFRALGLKNHNFLAYIIGYFLFILAVRELPFGGWLLAISMLMGGGALYFAGREGFGRNKGWRLLAVLRELWPKFSGKKPPSE
ncbi:MAG: hypothetical protein JW727_06220 [Candidatus Aenigmarchaeota archaeon]|nr:hypothetical protein [Candidatus Aenigmarchaeota archaeon]